jgi:hypothetical protein
MLLECFDDCCYYCRHTVFLVVAVVQYQHFLLSTCKDRSETAEGSSNLVVVPGLDPGRTAITVTVFATVLAAAVPQSQSQHLLLMDLTTRVSRSNIFFCSLLVMT